MSPHSCVIGPSSDAFSERDIRRTSGAFEAVADSTSAGEPLMQGSSETAATAVSGLSNADEEVQATVGRPRRDPALSERDLTRLRVRAYRARQHSSRILQTAQPQDNALFSNWIDSENQCSAQDNPCSPQNDPTLPVRFHQGDDAQQATSDWRRINSSSSASSTTLTSDFALAPFDTNDHYPIADDHYRSLSPDRSIREDPTFPAADRIQVDLPYLDSFIEALQAQETRSGLDFLESQTTTYDRIFKTLFTAECHCSGSHETHDHARSHSLQERARFLQNSLPPLTTVFDERFAHEATKYLHQWKEFLSDEPAEPLSFHKTEATLERGPAHVERRWDVDSIWFGPKSLQAIRKPGIFRLSFMPPFKRNLSTDQVIRPHGLDLATSRHILFGSVNTSGVRFDVYLFFPEASKASASRNGLSLDRQKDLYDSIIIPAAFSSISDPLRQELPRSFDIAYAKSRSFQERPEMGRWRAGDDSRACHLQYTLPTDDLAPFWSSIVQKADSFLVRTKSGESVTYFKNPRLLFQSHDLKNIFATPTLHETMTLVHDTILSGMDPEQMDLHSCWLDIGTRDYVPDQKRGSDNRVEPFTLLWKSDCHQHLHQRLSAIAPATPLAASHFRSFLLRDIGTYHSRIKATGAVTPGCPRSREPAVIRAKAYNCNKELFSVMYSNYRLFGSGYLPLLAFDDEMIDDLSSSSQSRERGTRTQLSRAAILKAWNANKRHLRSVSDPKMLSNYGVRKEVTLRFDIILMMWANGYFQATRESHTGPLNRTAPLVEELGLHHSPFWTIPTKEINAILFTQAARFVLPLDHLFFRAGTGFTEQPAQSNVAERYVQSILGFYTAQMLCRLLVHSFIGEKMLHYDQWIWLSRWTVLNRPSRRREELLERQGLGLEDTIMTSGMLWIPSAKMDWQRGHLALDVLVGLYIPRNPLHPRLASQVNVQTLTVSKITVDMFFQQWLKEARVAFESDQNQEAEELVERAFSLAVEEIARAYHQHILLKLQSYWERDRLRIGQDKVPPLIRLQEGMEESAAEDGQIVTAQTIWEVYAEAWALYAQLYSDTDPDKLPQELPYWMTTRKYVPPHDGWSSFVFRHLFHRPSPPSWNHLYFLRLYRAFKESWETVQQYAGPFDRRFRHVIGDFIMVALNSSQRNEVGTYQHDKSWYQGKPTFFKIQFWAPYFSPPEDNVRIPWQWVRDHETRHPDIAPDTKSEDMTVEYFHSLERVLCRLWWKCMFETDRLCNTGLARRSLICLSVLEHFSRLVGPRWCAEHERPYLLPWHLPHWEDRERGREDFLLLPISAGIVLKEYEGTKHFRPTILLPTRHNMMWLLNVVESVPDLCERTQEQIQWMDKVLDNNEGQFALRSHLNAKATATAERDQDDPLLRCFLSQTEPPQRVVQSDECAYNTDEGEENGCFIALDEDGHCDDESSEEAD
ncbi:hypothetical protein MRS44_018891 [Fusarium solani]|uniref:uncharacterized protein n=1 Tax=Fusarium solani TaxID=169388 RepID=UPI0032C431F9|nr:hypothetical protein MRS44_018891 [Fusarium solani]